MYHETRYLSVLNNISRKGTFYFLSRKSFESECEYVHVCARVRA